MGKIDFEKLKEKAVIINEPDLSYIDGKHLRELRMKLHFSQSVFASYLGVTKKAIEKWEQGKNPINKTTSKLLYLIENDYKILSKLKDVKVNNNAFDYNYLTTFDVVNVENDKSICEYKKIECCNDGSLWVNRRWKKNKTSNSLGVNYECSI